LIASGRHLQLHLISDGPDRSSLEQLVRDRQLSRKIVFEGSVNQDRIRTFYEAADVFAPRQLCRRNPGGAYGSHVDGNSSIATCINGIPELIRDGSEGLLVPPSDSGALAAAIARLRDDAALRESLGKAGRGRIRKAYNLYNSADHLAGVFRRRLDTD
jgi:colanic acid/amylovoran biosynthesis glycosyltransferase